MLGGGARPGRGITLAEILIALVIIGLLAAVLYPTVIGQLRQGQSAALANQLNSLRQALAAYKQNVVFYPRVLTQLTNQPPNLAATSCNPGNLPANQHLLWRGPYLTQDIQAAGIPVGDALVQNAIVRNPLTTAGGQAGLLQITVQNVDSDINDDLEQQFDGNGDPTAGSILWGPVGSSGTLTFRIPIRGC